MNLRVPVRRRWIVGCALLAAFSGHAAAQEPCGNGDDLGCAPPLLMSPKLNEKCVATLSNRSVALRPGGFFALQNVPVDSLLHRVQIVCKMDDGRTVYGSSPFFRLQPDSTQLDPISFDNVRPIPESLSMSLTATLLTTAGAAAQATITARYTDGTTADASSTAGGTVLRSSNPAIVVVDPNVFGRIVAVSSGTALISATNDGVLTTVAVTVTLGGDADGDGIPDDYERVHPCMNPTAPDAGADPDADGLVNSAEFARGTDSCVDDTDGDGLKDGMEVSLGSNPLLADSDADGVLDGLEPAGDFDGDGLPNIVDRDSDNDGLPDGVEVRICGTIICANPLADSDGDRLTNLDEIQLFTDPLAFDTDHDGLGDGDEALAGTDPLVPDNTPPVVAISQPPAGAQLVRGDTVNLAADATDDGRVVKVEFVVDGVTVGTDTVAPYGVSFDVPPDAASVTVESIATDTNHNSTRSAAVIFDLINDPLTSVTGTVRDDTNALAVGASATVRLPEISVEGGSTSLSGNAAPVDPNTHIGQSQISGTIDFEPGNRPLRGALVDLAPAGEAVVTGTVAFDFTGYNPQTPTPIKATVALSATAPSGLHIAVQGTIDGFIPVTGQTPLETDLQVTSFSAGGLSSALPLEGLSARIHLIGSLGMTVTPGTSNVTSVTLTASLNELALLNLTANTGSDGRFSISGVPTIYGPIVVDAEFHPAARPTLRGSSAPVSPVRGGTTDVGTIHLAQPPAVSIFPYPLVRTGRAPTGVSVGDFNGDGKDDMVVAAATDNVLSVFLGDGQGYFGPESRYPLTTTPITVITPDLNGDGRLDLVSVQANANDVIVFLGNGDGTFQTPFLRATFGINGETVAAGDLDGDGRLDLVVAGRTGAGIVRLLGNGDGTFRVQPTIPIAGGPRGVAIGDLNGDGKSDVVVTDINLDEVSVLLGNGDGTFQAETRLPAGDAPHWAAIGDFDHDGKRDFTVTNYSSGDVSVYLGHGDGTFAQQIRYPVGTGAHTLVVGDFNGGGIEDLAVSNELSDDVSVLLGRGDGTFRPQMRFAGPDFCRSLAIGDFDHDGIRDLAMANGNDNSASVMFGRGNGTFKAQKRVELAPNSNARALVTADFNGDGRPDIAVTEANHNAARVFLGIGDGTFGTGVAYGVGANPLAIGVGDVNGDGKQDLVVPNANSSNVSILLGNGDGSFSPHSAFPAGGDTRDVALGDFNGDGTQDLVVANFSSDGLNVLLGNGDGTFQPRVRVAPTSDSFNSVVVGDFNHDGKQDLAAVIFFSISVGVALGNGDGTFATMIFYPAGQFALAVARGDFNGDGNLDLAVADIVGDRASVLLGNGDGTFGPTASYQAGDSSINIATGDFDGDGRDDIAVANGEAENRDVNDVGLFLGKGDGTFPAFALRLTVGQTPNDIAVADFNGDGRLDMAVVNRDTDTVSILLNEGR